LKRLGKVLHVSSSGNLIVHADIAPEIGSKIVDEKLKEVGSVYDVIGPVDHPYVTVRPVEKSEAEKYVGKTLYILNGKGERRGKRKSDVKSKSSGNRRMKAP